MNKEKSCYQWECCDCNNTFDVESMFFDWVEYCPFCNSTSLIENEAFINIVERPTTTITKRIMHEMLKEEKEGK